MVQYNISFAGAGKVAGALSRKMYNTGHSIELIVSETEKNGSSVANSCKARWSQFLIFPDSTDIIIVAVPDHRLKSVLDKIICRPATLVAHTAGSIGIDIFPDHLTRRAVFYPLQTFSGGRKIFFKDVSFFLESSDKQSDTKLKNLTESIGAKAYFTDTEHRRMLHLAAVFVSNFTNHMLTSGKDIAEKAGFPFEILRPLIVETYLKALDNGPENSQTGPAMRNDKNTVKKHLELLSFSDELYNLYIEITRSISKYYTSKC